MRTGLFSGARIGEHRNDRMNSLVPAKAMREIVQGADVQLPASVKYFQASVPCNGTALSHRPRAALIFLRSSSSWFGLGARGLAWGDRPGRNEFDQVELPELILHVSPVATGVAFDN